MFADTVRDTKVRIIIIIKGTDGTNIKTRAKDVLPNTDHMQAAEITPPPLAATEWSRLLVRDVICSKRIPFRCCRG